MYFSTDSFKTGQTDQTGQECDGCWGSVQVGFCRTGKPAGEYPLMPTHAVCSAFDIGGFCGRFYKIDLWFCKTGRCSTSRRLLVEWAWLTLVAYPLQRCWYAAMIGCRSVANASSRASSRARSLSVGSVQLGWRGSVFPRCRSSPSPLCCGCLLLSRSNNPATAAILFFICRDHGQQFRIIDDLAVVGPRRNRLVDSDFFVG